ncbi:MAG: lamin tail domain-containing protein [Bacteroidales bacterium]|nr:lamin tail domain-containing protein [Bacteroidales bacterium]
MFIKVFKLDSVKYRGCCIFWPLMLLFILMMSWPATQVKCQVVFNEVSSANFSGITDEDGDFEDWIELYNTGSQPVNLKGWVLTDNPDLPGKWKFPEIIIEPQGFLIVFASDKNRKVLIDHFETAVYNTDSFRYVNPTSEPDRFWRDPEFVDTTWQVSPGGFGHGTGFYHTKVYDTLISVFLRKKFTVSNPEDIVNAQFHLDYDDGFIAFLNGFEIFRKNLKPDGKLPEFNQAAWRQHPSQWVNGEPAELFTINRADIHRLLAEGENVLAIQLHNHWLDEEMSINPFLSFGIQSQSIYFREPPPWFYHDPLYLHTNFKLEALGEPLLLFDAQGNLRDQLIIPELPYNASYGRVGDGNPDFCYFADPSPNATNTTQQCFSGTVPGLTMFFPVAGLYDITPRDSMRMNIFALSPDLEIRYTLDGSEPNSGSALYTNEIYITGTTVVKARLFKEGYLPGDIAVSSYIINKSTNLPVFSVSTNPELLWDYETGIYVTGPDADPNFPYFGANFWRDIEIPASIEYFGTGTDRIFQQEAGVKIHGGWSRAFAQKSLRLTNRSSFGTSAFNHPFFKDKNILDYKKLILRNGGNDFQSAMMRDGLIHKMVQKVTNMAVQDYQPSVVYLNGEYWGIHNLREKIDEDFLFENFALDSDEVDLLEKNNLIIEGDNTDFIALYDFIISNDLGDENNFNVVTEQLEITNVIDYFVVELFIINTDWPQNNVKYWKQGDGKWQYIFLDADNAMDFNTNLQHYTKNSYTRVMEDSVVQHSVIFQRLLENSNFRRDFINRYADLMNTIFLPENSIALIENIRDSIIGEMAAHKAKWGGSVSFWNNFHVNTKLKGFFQNRPEYARLHTIEEFGLDTVFTLTLNTANGMSSRIRLNTIIPDNYPWNGIYFYDNPVQVEALPAPGMEFSHWQSSQFPVLTDSLQRMWWHLSANDTLTAHFIGVPDTLKLVFTEINYKSHEEMDAGDWVELFNPNETEVDISGWIFKGDSDFSSFIFPENTLIQPGSYLVLAQDTARFSAINKDVANVTGSFNFGLKTWSSQVRLFDRHENLIVSMQYFDQSPWPGNIAGTGRTIELISPELDINDPQSWKAGCPGGSPGSEPYDCMEDFNVCFTEFNYKSYSGFDTKDWVEIYNYDTVPVDLGFWVFRDNDGAHEFVLPYGLQLDPGSFLVLCEDTAAFRLFNPGVEPVIGNFDFGLSSDSDKLRLYDPWENMISQLEYSSGAPWPPDVSGTGRTAEVIDYGGDISNGANWRSGCLGGSPGMFPLPCHDTAAIVVTEINYAASDEFDSGDWIEIFNHDTVPVVLNGWRFRDDNPGHNYSFPDGLILMPEEFIVLVEDSVRFKLVHDTVTRFTGEFDFGLSATSDEVHLYDIFGQEIAFIGYQSTLPWPANIPGTGRTIELIDPEMPMNSPQHWKAGCPGGSPASSPFECPGNYKLAFTEFNYNSYPGFDTKDWVEIHNYDSVPVDLSSWRFEDNDPNNRFTLSPGTHIAPGGFLVLCGDTAAFRSFNPGVTSIMGNFDFGLSSENDHLRLYDPWEELVLLVEYSSGQPWPQHISGTGRTAEVIDFTGELNNGLNWHDGCLGGSPGMFPLPCHDTARIVVTEICYNSLDENDTGDWLEIYNNNSVTVSLNGWKLKNSAGDQVFHFPDEITLQPGMYFLVVQDSLRFMAAHDTIYEFVGSFGFDLDWQADEIHLFDIFDQEIVNISYQAGSPWPFNFSSSKRTIELIDPDQNGSDPVNWKIGCRGGSPGTAPVSCDENYKIALTEFNYKSFPKFDTKDWVEIFNYDTVNIDLSYWKFVNESGDHAFVFPEGFQLVVGEFLLICSDTTEFSKFNPELDNITGNFEFDLSEYEDALQLSDPWENLVVLVDYSNEPPWPQAISGTGRTAELIDFAANSNDPSNWKAGCLKGSPGGFPVQPCNDTTTIVVSEINYSISADLPTGSWFELFNPNDFVVELDGWTFQNADENPFFQFPDGIQLVPDAYLVVVEDSLKFLSVHDTIPGFVGGYGIGLSEIADEFRLFDFFDQEIIYISYQSTEPWPVNTPGSGRTIELIDYGEALNNPLNWKIGCRGGSPGMAYIDCDDYSIPENLLEKLSVKVYPNPFTSDFTIELTSDESLAIEIKLKNNMGYEISSVFDGVINAGKKAIGFHSSNLGKGVYFLQINSGGYSLYYKLIAY